MDLINFHWVKVLHVWTAFCLSLDWGISWASGVVLWREGGKALAVCLYWRWGYKEDEFWGCDWASGQKSRAAAPRLLGVQDIALWCLSQGFAECGRVCFSSLPLGGRDTTPWPAGERVYSEGPLLWLLSSIRSFAQQIFTKCLFCIWQYLGMWEKSRNKTHYHPCGCS